MKKPASSLSDADCLETLVRSLVESSDMSVGEMLQVTGRLFGASNREVGHVLNSNPFQGEPLTFKDVLGEAVSNTVKISREK